MKLWQKFSLLLSACLLVSLLISTLVQLRFFLADQEAYQQELQATYLQFSQEKFLQFSEGLYSHFESHADGKIIQSPIQNVISLSLWQNEKLLAESGEKIGVPPVSGGGRWTITNSPSKSSTPAIRWIGRYTTQTVALDMPIEILGSMFKVSHGISTSLVDETGKVIMETSPSGETSSPNDKKLFGKDDLILKEILSAPPNLPITKPFSTNDQKHLGTFVLLPTEPRLLLIAKTPWNQIQMVLNRTVRQSIVMALLFLAMAFLFGTLFAKNLTEPLSRLTVLTSRIAEGKFDQTVEIDPTRKDEVASLSKSFNKMTLEMTRVLEELKQNERLASFGKFGAFIAHEIKNPLSAILGNVQLVERDLSELGPSVKPETHKALQWAASEVKRAANLLNQLLKFTRHDKNPDTTMDVALRLRSTLEMAKSILDENKIEMKVEIPQKPVLILGNSDELHEVFLNLIVNAAYAMKDSKIRKLEVTLIPGTATIVFSDTGGGISPKDLPHVFEPFFTTKPRGQGTGLGLAICHGIITTHKGKIKVESEVGRGTKFTIDFPLKN